MITEVYGASIPAAPIGATLVETNKTEDKKDASNDPIPDALKAADLNDTDDKKETSKSFDRRKLLDSIRKGVVIIKTKVQVGGMSDVASWSGTGFIVDLEKGLIATNHHVVGNTVCTYEIKFSDGTTTPAKLKYFDPLHDFAFLKIDPSAFPKNSLCLELSDDELKVNDTVYSMGNSAGDEFSTFKGTVFSVYENIGPFSEQTFRFSGLTVGGASGSPVFSETGKVVGIIYGGKFVSGAALQIRYVIDALVHLQKGEIPPRYSLGVTIHYSPLRESLEAGLIPAEKAEEYQKVFPEANNKVLIIDARAVGSDAMYHLDAGDIVWKVDDQFIGPELYKLETIVNKKGDKEVILHVYRNSKLLEIKIKPYKLRIDTKRHFIRFAGATWFADSEQTRLTIGDEGPSVYMCPVEPVSAFKDIYRHNPLFPNQPVIITHIEGHPIKTLEDLVAVIKKIKGKTRLVVKYIDMVGSLGFDSILIADRVERQSLLNYQSKFDTPKEYKFNPETEEWDIQEIK
jgi:S1-C subfamily serine protease